MRDIVSPLSGFGSPFGRRADLLNATAIARLLFSSNEPGFFYDFDDWSTLFQDTAGTQPVTAPNQGVALALDKRLGLELGPELVTNGDFSDGITGWFNLSGVTSEVVESEAQVTVGTGGRGIQRVVPFVEGRTYEITADIRLISGSGSVRVSATNSSYAAKASSPVVSQNTAQKVKFLVSAGSDTDRILLVVTSGGETGGFDNISVRELAGNHATQATTAARPLTAVHPDGGVRNLLDHTEDFGNSVWLKNAITATLSTQTHPLGAVVWDVAETTADAQHFIRINENAEDAERGYNVDIKSNGVTTVVIQVAAVFSTINLLDGSTLSGPATTTALGGGWFRVSLSGVTSSNAANAVRLRQIESYVGDVSSGIFVARPQVELGSEATPYQRRVNFLDVTEAGKRSIRRLYFNGTSHFMQTPTITPNTDKAQVFAGVRKLSDAARGAIAESSANPGGFSGIFSLTAPAAVGSLDTVRFTSRGTGAYSSVNSASVPAPRSFVLTGYANIAANVTALKIDGGAPVEDTTTVQSPGNYLAHPVFIGARGGTALFFNGYIDQLITRFGPNLDTATIENTEKYVSTKSPEVTL